MSNNDEQQMDFVSQFVSNNPDSIIDSMNQKNKDANFEKNENKNTNTEGYIELDINSLPMCRFYKRGTKIKIKKASVEDTQEYTSMLDDNYLDVVEKMNSMLSSCVKVIFPNGMVSNYKELKDDDRYYIIFKIRELTFDNDKFFSKEIKCKSCKKTYEAFFRTYNVSETEPKTFYNEKYNEKLEKFFVQSENVFQLNISGKSYKIAPPCIGLSESFLNYTKEIIRSKEEPNVSFLKIAPFLLYDRNKISDEGIVKKEKEFKSMDMETFQILNSFINKMKFGVKGIKNVCPHCKVENESDLSYKGGASDLFVARKVGSGEFDDLFND